MSVFRYLDNRVGSLNEAHTEFDDPFLEDLFFKDQLTKIFFYSKSPL